MSESISINSADGKIVGEFKNGVTQLNETNLNKLIEAINKNNDSIRTETENRTSANTALENKLTGSTTNPEPLTLNGLKNEIDGFSSEIVTNVLVADSITVSEQGTDEDSVVRYDTFNSKFGDYFSSIENQSTLKIERVQSEDRLSVYFPDGIQTPNLSMNFIDSYAKINGVVYAQEYQGYAGGAPRFNSGIEVRGEITGEPKVSVPSDSLTNKSSTAVANVKFVHDILSEFTILNGGDAINAEKQARLDAILYRMDVNEDGYIDQNDLQALNDLKLGIEAGATTIPEDGRGDLNFDGKIDDNDMWILMNYINQGILPE